LIANTLAGEFAGGVVAARVPHGLPLPLQLAPERDHVTPRLFGSFETVAVNFVVELLPGLMGPDCAETDIVTFDVIVIPANPDAPLGGEELQLAFSPSRQSSAAKSTNPGVPPPPGFGTDAGAV
jgi:hypothetical protein